MNGAKAKDEIAAVYDAYETRYAAAVAEGDTAVEHSGVKTAQTFSGVRHIRDDAASRADALKALFGAPRTALKQKKRLNRARRSLSFWAVWARLHPRVWWARFMILGLFVWANRRPIVMAIVVVVTGWLLFSFWQDIFDFLGRAWRTMQGLSGSAPPQPPPASGGS